MPATPGFVPGAPAPRPSRAPSKPGTPAKAGQATAASAPTAVAAKPVAPPQRRTPASAPKPAAQTAPQRGDAAAAAAPAPVGGAGGPSVVLFRTDLRLDDHAALSLAAQSSSRVVALYCFDPRQFGRSALGFDRTGLNSARFLLGAVSDLRARLRAKGSDLVVRVGAPEAEATALARAVGAHTVYLHAEPGHDALLVELGLSRALAEEGLQLCAVPGNNSLYHGTDLPFRAADAPQAYADFRDAVARAAHIRPPVNAPDTLAALPAGVRPGALPDLARLGLRDDAGLSAIGTIATRGGEREALGRMAMFVRGQWRPAGARARSLGAEFAQRVAPWLALGCVSPRRIFHEVRGGMDEAEALGCETYYELVWRDFLRSVTARSTAKRLGAAQASSARVH